MDAITFISAALGVVLMLAGFYAYVRAQFVSKDVADLQFASLTKSLDGIAERLDKLSESHIVKSTISELADRLAEVYGDRIPIRREH